MVAVRPGRILKEEFTARAFGNDAQFWLNLQAQYDLAVACRDVGKRVEAEVQTAEEVA